MIQTKGDGLIGDPREWDLPEGACAFDAEAMRAAPLTRARSQVSTRGSATHRAKGILGVAKACGAISSGCPSAPIFSVAFVCTPCC